MGVGVGVDDVTVTERNWDCAFLVLDEPSYTTKKSYVTPVFCVISQVPANFPLLSVSSVPITPSLILFIVIVPPLTILPSVVFNVPEKRTLSPALTFEGIESKVKTVECIVGVGVGVVLEVVWV